MFKKTLLCYTNNKIMPQQNLMVKKTKGLKYNKKTKKFEEDYYYGILKSFNCRKINSYTFCSMPQYTRKTIKIINHIPMSLIDVLDR